MAETEFTIYYWPELPGRAEFARLILWETDTPWSEPFSQLGWSGAFQGFSDLKNSYPGFFAVPLLKHTPPGGTPFYLSQTHAICKYLAKKCGDGILYGQNEIEEFQMEELSLGLVDWTSEGHTAWHAKDRTQGYAPQAEYTQPFIQAYKDTRLRKWLQLYDKRLELNGTGFLVGSRLSYVDLGLWYLVLANERCAPEVFEEMTKQGTIPRILQHRQMVEARPKIQQWVAERAQRGHVFSDNGTIF